MQKLLLSAAMTAALILTGCGDDGATGPAGPTGAVGADGSNGTNSLIRQTALAEGDDTCPAGGVQFDSGLDLNSDDTLQDSEVDMTEFTCAPGRATVSASDVLSTVNNPWFQSGAAKVAATAKAVGEVNGSVSSKPSQGGIISTKGDAVAFAKAFSKGQAKNVILFVGDGMGVSTVTSARILDGQNKGELGEENILSFGAFPFTGLAKTYNVDAQTPDSAGTMTAMMSGVKTDVGVIGVDEDIERGDCATVAGNELTTTLEIAELAGKATGIISTARITHATPAATYAKSADRNWEDISDMPQAAIDAGCTDIADQLVNFEANLEAKYEGRNVDGLEVVMGGGRRHFLPKDAAFNSPDAVSSTEGDRTDGRDLTAEWQTLYPTGDYIFDQAGFDAIDGSTERVFGLFNESHMQYAADRGNDIAGEPSLTEMTTKAIDVLDNDADGFFLMVESGRIDHAHHAGNASGALTDTIEFASAVQAAFDATNPEETLIIVTADHGHVFTIAGYPKRGNPILGKVVNVGATEPALAGDDLPYTTLGYMNGSGFADLGAQTDSDVVYEGFGDIGRQDLTSVDTTTPGFHQEALIPTGSETHSGEDVGIYASGPGAHLVAGTHEQNDIFHIMDLSADLVAQAD